MIEKTYLKTFAYFWPVAFVIGAILYGLGTWVLAQEPLSLALSYLLGATVSMMLMSHNYKSLIKVSHDDPTRLARTTMRNYVFRYLFYGVILALAFLQEFLIVWPVFLGFITFKFVMVVTFASASRRDDHG